MTPTEELVEKSDQMVRRIKPIMAGRGPEVTGVTLVQLLALWLAGHHPDSRKHLLKVHLRAVEEMVPVMEAEIFARKKRPESWPPMQPPTQN